MFSKAHSQSNVSTDDWELEEREMNVKALLEDTAPILDVWAHNFAEQLHNIRQLAQKYNVIAVDTEFPGSIVCKHALTPHYAPQDLDYQHTWHNVEQTALIQLGITLADSQGNTPSGTSTWQFHLRFDLATEKQAPNSIKLLHEAGINFDKLCKEGIPHHQLAEGLMGSGLVLNKAIRWVVFHGSYDFAYLLRLLRNQPLPRRPSEFYKSIRIYFPCIYDLKHMVEEEDQFSKKGLNAIAETIGCARVGPKHQAGSDSLLTVRAYFKLRSLLGERHFEDRVNLIYGIRPAEPVVQYAQQFSYVGRRGFGEEFQMGPLYQYLKYSGSYPAQVYGFYTTPNQQQ